MENDNAYRLDVTKGNKTLLGKLPGEDIDVSPDERRVLTKNGDSIMVTDIAAWKTRTAHKASGFISKVNWLTDTTLVVSTNVLSTSVVDLSGKVIVNLPNSSLVVVSSDGSGFLFGKDAKPYPLTYYYDVKRRLSRQIPGNLHTSTWLFLSKDILVFWSYSYDSNPTCVNVLKLSDMTIAPLGDWPDSGNIVGLSPDFARYWVAHLPMGEWSGPGYICVHQVPESSARSLKKLSVAPQQRRKNP
jgi:hypothetical protein